MQVRPAAGRTDTVRTCLRAFFGCNANRHQLDFEAIFNGAFLRVSAVFPDMVKLRDDDLDKEEFKIPVSQ